MVVFFDIDGTVIDDDTQIIPQSAIEAIARLRRNGHIPVVNTGRPYSHVDPRIKAMDFAGFICACGMEILLDGKWLVRRRPEPGICRQIRQAALDCNVQVLYEEDGAIVRDGAHSVCAIARGEVELMRNKGYEILEAEEMPEFRFVKFCCYPQSEDNREEFRRRVQEWYYAIDRDSLWEFVMQGSSKAGGMGELIGYLGIPVEQTLAMGDSANDIAMFSMAEHTVCMGGGMDVLKKKAEYITDTVLEDGLAKALRHFDLI